jgi:type II secretory pathway predicted ATPase ExeA
LIENHRRVGLFLGERGVGKSTLLQVLAGRLQASGVQLVRCSLHGVDAREMLWQIAAQFGVNPAREEEAFALWRLVEDQLSAAAFARRTVVLLLDDVDETYADAVPQLVRLAQCEALGDLRLSIVVAAHPRRTSRLGKRMIELVDLRIDLAAWEELDVRNYLHKAITAAGGTSFPFNDQAVARIWEHTAGNCRQVRHMAELALLAGASNQAEIITSEIVDAVYGELCMSDFEPTLA